MNRSQNTIVLCSDKNYLFALMALIENLRDKGFTSDINVYYSNIPLESIKNILKVYDKLYFIELPFDLWKSTLPKQENLNKNFETIISRYTHLTLCKYKYAELLSIYQKVLYLDLDVIINEDINQLFMENKSGYRDGKKFLSKYIKGSSDKISLTLQDFDTLSSPNAGLLYYTRDLPWKKFIQYAEFFITNNVNAFVTHLDELSIAYAYKMLSYDMVHFDEKIYNCFIRNYSYSATKITHFMGVQKPWNTLVLFTAFNCWFQYFSCAKEKLPFIDLDPNNNVKSFTGSQIFQLVNIDFWYNVLSKLNLSYFTVLEPIFSSIKSEIFLFKLSDNIFFQLKKDRYGGNNSIKIVINFTKLYSDKNKDKIVIFSEKFKLKLYTNSNGIDVTYNRPISVNSLQDEFQLIYLKFTSFFIK